MSGSGAARSVIIHAHFYQPPREDPSLELVEREANAAPWHDWNQRIARDCYRAVVAARVKAPDGRIARISNTLERISFNVGPTLAAWLEHEVPDTWEAMLEADRASLRRLGGHGNAIAMPYHHLILPLASRRDKETEVRWGIADFRRRFGRDPEGMWLPETAVDDETLDVLAAQGIRFTILAPHQVTAPPPGGRPGRYTTAHGRTIAVFPYDGPLSHGVAFGPLITSAEQWAGAVLARELPPDGPGLVTMATDGETYGHHHAFGEMALATVLERLAAVPGVRVENPAAWLARHPAVDPVELVAPSSWSCSHGIERWRADCGCRTRPGTSQAWRTPLREALDRLAAGLHRIFEEEGARHLTDPWRARDAWTAVGLPSHLSLRARELLEMERNALRMFTSCGWFFDDIGGLETRVVLRYAARAIDLAGEPARPLEDALREALAAAGSNDPAVGTGRDVYDRAARPAHPGAARVAAGYAALAALVPSRVRTVVGAWLAGPAADGGVEVHHRRTGRSWTWRTEVARHGGEGLTVRVSREGEAARTLGMADLPEYEQAELRHAFRRELREGLLTRAEEDQLLEGTADYRRLAADAVTRLLPAGPAGAEVDTARLGRALDLLATDGIEVPFEAVTRFWRLFSAGPMPIREALRPFLGRFGIAG